ncbi:MAG: DUF4340 domain-containing protein [Candidatus Eiseniibacteriota bacterium]
MISRKILLVLAGVLVALGLLSALTGRSRYATAEHGGFVELLEGSFDAAQVHKVRAWLGSLPDEPVVLERSGEGWAVASRWGWTAKEDLVKRLLDDFQALRGEKRASSSDVLADFEADDEKGLHVVAEAAGGSELFHLIVGKTSVRGGGFVRLAGSDDVYLTQSALRSSFGVWGDEPKAPDAKRWIELRVYQADRLDVDRIVVRDGAKELVLEKEFQLAAAAPPPAPADSAAAAAAASDTAAVPASPPGPDRAEWTWKRDAAGEFDKGKADGILSTLCSLYAFDVADPDSAVAYGLDAPKRSVDLVLQSGETVTIWFGADTEDEKKTWFRVGADGRPAVIYKSTVDRIFQKRQDLKPQA